MYKLFGQAKINLPATLDISRVLLCIEKYIISAFFCNFDIEFRTSFSFPSSRSSSSVTWWSFSLSWLNCFCILASCVVLDWIVQCNSTVPRRSRVCWSPPSKNDFSNVASRI